MLGQFSLLGLQMYPVGDSVVCTGCVLPLLPGIKCLQIMLVSH